MFITVTCCEEIAKKLIERFLQLFGVCVRIIAWQTPGLSRTKLIHQDFPGPGNFTDTIPGHSVRRGNGAERQAGRAGQAAEWRYRRYIYRRQGRKVELTVIGRAARRDAG